MASLDEVLAVLKESGDRDAREQRRLTETLRQALAEEERRKAELLADALARRLQPAEPEPPPAEPEPPPARREFSEKEVTELLEANRGIAVAKLHQQTGVPLRQLRRVKKKHGFPNATPGPKPKGE